MVIVYKCMSQVEVEMELDNPDMAGDEYGSSQPIISLVEEEEVVLYWNEGQKYRCIRDLASDINKENMDVLSYYRYIEI